MGVFARFRRKAKDGDEESTTGSGAATPTAESEGAEVSAATPATASPEAASAEEKPAEGAGEDTKSAAADGKVTQAAETAGTDAADDSADSADSADGVEIPKQQSAGEAADNEADEGARN